MILGLGTDLIDIRRIERTLERFGTRFVDRIFTAEERERSQRLVYPAAAFAKQFAAKEACSKALGTGFRQGVYWRDMKVVSLPSGKPTMALTGGALLRLTDMVPEGMAPRIDVSLTDDLPLAQAVVLISAVPRTATTAG